MRYILLIFGSIFLNGVAAQPSDQYDVKFKQMMDSSEHYLKINPVKSLTFSINAYEIARLMKDKTAITRSNLQLGIIYRLNGNLDLSERHLLNALSSGKKTKYYAAALKESGITAKQKYHFDKALDYYLQALQFFESDRSEEDIAAMHNNIGRLYFAMNDYDKAMHHYRISLKIKNKYPDKITAGIAMHNIGAVNEKINRKDSALLYYKKALKSYKINNDQILIAYAYASIGNIEPDIDSAGYYLLKSREIRNRLQLTADLLETDFYLGKLNIRKNRWKEAEKILSQVYEKAVSLNRQEYAMESATLLADLFRRENNINGALIFERNTAQWKDSLYQREKKVKELGFNYRQKEFRQKEKLNALNRENKSKEERIQASQAELEKEKQLQFFSVIIILMVVLIALILTFFVIRFKNINRKLDVQNKLIEQKSNENEILVREVHHRVKNNLNTMMSLLRMEKRRDNKLSAAELVTNVEERLLNIAFIHEILYNHPDLTSVDMKEYLHVILKKIISLYPEKNINIEMEGNVFLDADKALYVGQLAAELITNSCKHAFSDNSNPVIKMMLNRNDVKCFLEYSDNGSGFSDSPKKQTFGMKLIEAHGKKLKADIKEFSLNGYHCTIEFKV